MRPWLLPVLTVLLLSAGVLRSQAGTSAVDSMNSSANSKNAQQSWKAWQQARDAELANVGTSYLSVLDHAMLRAGESVYLPLGGPRGQVSWRKEAPGKPMVSLSAKDGRVNVFVTSTGESLDLLDRSSGWSTPDGMLVTLQKNGADYLLVLRDPMKDGFKDFKGARYFPFDAKAIIHAHLNALARPEKLTVMTTQDKPRQLWLMGTLEFSYDGSKTQLKAYCLGETPSTHELFVPFLDATNGIETYSGGRYVEAAANATGDVTIDFNRAYNPYCARNHIFNCIKVSGKPIEARILAGELTPKAR